MKKYIIILCVLTVALGATVYSTKKSSTEIEYVSSWQGQCTSIQGSYTTKFQFDESSTSKGFVVKFFDGLDVRIREEKLVSLCDADFSGLNDFIEKNNIDVSRQHYVPEEDLLEMNERARQYWEEKDGSYTPDLLSSYIMVPPDSLNAKSIAKKISELPYIENVNRPPDASLPVLPSI